MESESKVLMLKTSQRIPSVHFGLPCLLSEIFKKKLRGTGCFFNGARYASTKSEPALTFSFPDFFPARKGFRLLRYDRSPQFLQHC